MKKRDYNSRLIVHDGFANLDPQSLARWLRKLARVVLKEKGNFATTFTARLMN